jgi:hypothetical protein
VVLRRVSIDKYIPTFSQPTVKSAFFSHNQAWERSLLARKFATKHAFAG